MYKQNDSAFYYFNKVVNTSKDTLQVAGAFNQMAAIQSDAGDHFGAQENLIMSLQLLDEKDPKHWECLASDYNELGMEGNNLKDYDAAITYFNSAIKFSVDSMSTLAILNNQANAYRNKKDYAKALKIYRGVLAKRKKLGTKIEYARVLCNIATTKWLMDPQYNPAPELLESLLIRQKEKDRWGQNSSFIHLAEYYANSRPDSALYYSKQLYNIAREINSPDDQLDALQKLVRLAPLQDTKRYFARYQQLSDSVQTSRNAAKNQFALIRYDAEKNKADNFKLQKDNTEKRYQIIKQQTLMGGILLATLTGGIGLSFWYRKRKQRIEMEADRSIRNSQLKTSKKVHDVVANGLYRIMAEIEHKEDLDKEELLDQIEAMYEQSRDISYEKQPIASENFHEKISSLLTSFASPETKVVVVSNNENTWATVENAVKEELRHVVLELMINMKKHSKAKNVAVRFERKEGNLLVNYTDDGIGLPEKVVFGNGLFSTSNRVQAINGQINLSNGPVRGLQISICVPIV
ncbi:MAG: histidine kinase [Pedobacter sp.]|nr:histidine kinase [Pedobacter sp.]